GRANASGQCFKRCKVSDHEHDALIDEIASELKRPVRFSESFDARVMSAIRTSHLTVVRGERAHAKPGGGRRRVFVPALASLAAAAVLTIMVVRAGKQTSTQQIADATPVTQVANLGEETLIPQDQQVSLFMPHAKSVGVMGAFNDWDASRSQMTRQKDGTWTITLRVLPGSYEYQFLVDGKTRMTDPSAPATDSEFGEANSVLTVTPRMR
ncbi:MAG: isoamylase early set domain-containing protein, partial [Gemmatimonadaceae bacterium]